MLPTNLTFNHPDLTIVFDSKADWFVFRPGGVPKGRVFTDFQALAVAMAAVDGFKILQFDDSIMSPIDLPAGTFNMRFVAWTGLGPRDGSERPRVRILDGCHLPGLRFISGQVSIECMATGSPTVPSSDFAPGGSGTLVQVGMRTDNGLPVIRCTGQQPLFDCGAADVKVNFARGIMNLPGGSNAIFRLGAGGRLTTNLQALAQLGARVVEGPAGSTWNLALWNPGIFALDQSAFLGTFSIQTPGSRSRSRVMPPGIGGAAPEPSPEEILGAQTGDTLLLDTRVADVTQTLPDILTSFKSLGEALNTVGFDVTVKNVRGSNTVNVIPVTGQLIDGGPGPVMVGPSRAITFRSDGVAGYYIVAVA